MWPQIVALCPGAARSVIGAPARPACWNFRYSRKCPLRHPVWPGRSVAISFDAVANGDLRLPGFPSLPLGVAKRVHACPAGVVREEASGEAAREAAPPIATATTAAERARVVDRDVTGVTHRSRD
jgi:hypothetical protein